MRSILLSSLCKLFHHFFKGVNEVGRITSAEPLFLQGVLDLPEFCFLEGPAIEPDSVNVVRRLGDTFVDETRLGGFLEFLNYLVAGPVTDWLQQRFFFGQVHILAVSVFSLLGALGLKKPFQEFFLFSLRCLLDNSF